jgi:hypothetical protein
VVLWEPLQVSRQGAGVSAITHTPCTHAATLPLRRVSAGDLLTGSTAVSRKGVCILLSQTVRRLSPAPAADALLSCCPADQLEFWLTKLRAEVDSLDQDG